MIMSFIYKLIYIHTFKELHMHLYTILYINTYNYASTHTYTHIYMYIYYIYIYILPYPRRVEFFRKWSNRVAISVYCKALHIWIKLSVAVKRMYVNNSNFDSYAFKIYFAATSSSWLRGRVSDWRLSQPSFDHSYGKLVCLATLMRSVCGWLYIYIYIYIYVYIYIYMYIYIYIHQHSADTRCHLEYLPSTMNDRDWYRKRDKGIRGINLTCWAWCNYHY